MLRPFSTFLKKHSKTGHRINLVLILYLAISGHQWTWGEHIDISWNTNELSEDWSDPGNWLPNQVPGIFNTVLIGDLPIADNAVVQLDVNASIGALTITDGMGLFTNGFTMNVEGNTLVRESNGTGLGQSRLEIENGLAGEDFTTNGLSVTSDSAVVLSDGAWLTVGGRFTADESTSIRGDGVIYLEKDGPILSAFSMNGRMQVESGVMEIFQAGTSLIDLDGSGNTGRIRIVSSPGAPNVLTISGTELNDAFDGRIDIRANGRLNMNLANDWTVGENGTVLLLGSPGNLAVIEGSDLGYRGDLSVYDGSVESNVTFFDTAEVEFFGDSFLQLQGDTTFAGASFVEFNDASVPRIDQNGSLTVTESTTLDIPSGVFNWDGLGTTVTTVEPSAVFTINAEAVDLFAGPTGGNYDGQTNVGVGGELVVNTPAAWINNGVVRLEQATLKGSGVVNDNLIQGSGSLSPAGINNRGTLRSFGGGLLTIGPNPGETGGVIVVPVPVDGIDALENGVIANGFDLDGTDEDGVLVAVDGDLRVDGFQGNFVFDGTLNIGFGNEYLMNTGGLYNRGTITITGGGEYRADLVQAGQLIVSLGVLDDAVIASDNLRFSSAGTNTLLADLNIQGNGWIETGAIFSGDSSLVNLSGSVVIVEQGTLIEVTVENHGRLEQFRNSMSGVELASLVNADIGTLVLNLAGDGGVPGLDFDQLIVLGTADLAGTLEINLLDGFMPSSGDEFTLLTAVDGIFGVFDSYDLPALTGEDEWFVRYEANEVILMVTAVAIPEPSTPLFAALAALGLLRRRSRVR